MPFDAFARGMTLRVVACFVAGAGLLAGVVGSRWFPDSALFLEGVLRDIQGLGLIGVFALVGSQTIVAFSGVLPASLIGITSGAIYGLTLGFPLACCSTMAGAFVAFGLSRSLLRPTIARLLVSHSRLALFDMMLAHDGWRFVFLMRLSPIMPFAATSYTLGLSSIRVRDYLIGSLASLPSLLGYVLVGSLATTGLAAMSQGSRPLQWALLGLGIVTTVVVTLRIGTLARSALTMSDLTSTAPQPATE